MIIIGSGIAALQLAHHISTDKNVMILTKSSLRESNSYLAQGGIAASVSQNDHFYSHFLDTMEAGRYRSKEEVVLKITEEAPKLIKELRDSGCPFDENGDGQLLLGMEGAHSASRIVHSGGDATGKHVIEFLETKLTNNITIEENLLIYELIISEDGICVGVKGKDANGIILHFYAPHIVLATGGCGYLFKFTSNSPNVIGDGLAMAFLAGAELDDMEFIQFHPTMLFTEGKIHGLISEAVRGQGGILVTKNGKKIMEGIHPLKDLAPRHIVSQAIFDYIKNGEDIFLDITSIENFKGKFPNITELCIENNIDLNKGLIPVVPGSHFLMGGITVDSNAETTIPGLYAIGEAACTGLHGANRLASNSLLEGLFYGKQLAKHINSSTSNHENRKALVKQLKKMPTLIDLPDLEELRNNMMERVGIVRNSGPLQQQIKWLETYCNFGQESMSLDDVSASDIQTFLACVTSLLITNSALVRTESRGGHFRSDFPIEDQDYWKNKKLIYQFGKGRMVEDEQNKAKGHA